MGYFLILPTHIFTHRYLRLSSLLCCFNTQLFQQPVTIKKPSQILSRKKVFLHKCLKKKYIRYHTNQHKHHRYYSRWYGVVICVFIHVLFLLAENEYEKTKFFLVGRTAGLKLVYKLPFHMKSPITSLYFR